MSIYYHYEDGLEDGTGFVSTPVGVTEKGAEEREEVDSAGPLADVVSRIGGVDLQNSGQKQH